LTGNVVDLSDYRAIEPKEPAIVFACGNCGGEHWFLAKTGFWCAACNKRSTYDELNLIRDK
jgi:predicted RNA-binding Zn-ribbon protein involved in translation (DUF1610 family)